MKTVLVTGSTDGIGLATSRKLAANGHKVLVHGRTEEKAQTALRKILADPSLKDPIPTQLLAPVWGDLSDLDQVVTLATQVQSAGPQLDVVLNNAGVYMDHRALTKQGFEMTFCVNHLAVHLLTSRLLPVLKSRPTARVVTVSSVAHQRAHLHFDNLNAEKKFDAYEAYSASKLCNILFTRCLAALLKDTKMTVNCLHPGVIDTKLLRAGFNIQGDTLEMGSETSYFLATSPSVENMTGGYYVSSKLSYPSRVGQDDKLAVQLWRKTEEILKPWLQA
jgi:NAD(P)-dependent dehydrogenase (short-subunit alcohol dehydrogenase family)